MLRQQSVPGEFASRNPADELVAHYGVDTVVAALQDVLSPQRIARIDEVLASRLTSVTCVLENLYDAHNGAAALRSLEALGVSSAYAVEANSRFQASSAVTIGCHKWMSVHRFSAFTPCADALRAKGFRLLAACPDPGADLSPLDGSEPVAIVVGNEKDGLTPETIAACDATVCLPMFGFSQSFNLSVSVALLADKACAARRKALGGLGDMPVAERDTTRAAWFIKSVRGAEQILERYARDSQRESA